MVAVVWRFCNHAASTLVQEPAAAAICGAALAEAVGAPPTTMQRWQFFPMSTSSQGWLKVHYNVRIHTFKYEKNWAPGMHLWDSKRAGIHIWDFWMEQSIWVFTCVATGKKSSKCSDKIFLLRFWNWLQYWFGPKPLSELIIFSNQPNVLIKYFC